MARAHRQRGSIEELPSGAFRVRVHAGIDPLTRRPHYLRETVPAGPQARREAERVRTRLLAQVDEHKNPKTRATLNQLLDRWLQRKYGAAPDASCGVQRPLVGEQVEGSELVVRTPQVPDRVHGPDTATRQDRPATTAGMLPGGRLARVLGRLRCGVLNLVDSSGV